jgi:predicted branched-subunit amino acid permease
MKKAFNRSDFSEGFLDGLPIGLGYLSVSFGFGILAVGLNIPVLGTVLISLTNLTSAGQAAGVEIIAAAGTLVEMALTQLVINIRYALMGFSLSQRLDGSFTTPKRLLLSFGITDEVYAVAISQPGALSAPYMAGLILLPVIGWTSGTLLGAVAGQLLPASIASAMGIVLYGMFIAIIIPPARKDKKVLAVVVMAAALSVVFKYLLTFVSGGFAVILSALIAAVVAAVLFPVKEVDA